MLTAKILLAGSLVGMAALIVAVLASGFVVIRRINRAEQAENAHARALEALGGHPMGLRELQVKAHAMARDKGWYDEHPVGGWYDGNPVYNSGTRFMLMVTEIAEAFEEVRNGHAVNEVYYKPGKFTRSDGHLLKPEGVPVELADVVIRILDFCGANGVDIESVVLEKMAYNATRQYRHGGKAA